MCVKNVVRALLKENIIMENKLNFFAITITILVICFSIVGCENPAGPGSEPPPGDPTPQELANAFKSGHSTILGKTIETITISDEAAVDAVLAVFTALTQNVKDLLVNEKDLLDSLRIKIDELKASASPEELVNAFKSGHSAILEKTVDTVTIDDEAAVDAALSAFAALAQDAKDLLGAEKDLLDDLWDKIDELKIAALTYTISGTISADNPSGPLAGASVTLKQGGSTIDTTTSAGNGTYTLSDVPNGTYSIEVSRTGYHNNTISEVIVSGGNVSGQDLMLFNSTVPAYIVSIELTQYKQFYNFGETGAIQAADFEVTATYNDGTTNVLDLESMSQFDYGLPWIDASLEGFKTVTFTLQSEATNYVELSESYEVFVIDYNRGFVELEIISPPTKRLYQLGEEFDLTGLVVRGKWNNATSFNNPAIGVFERTIENSWLEISTFNNYTSGVQAITITLSYPNSLTGGLTSQGATFDLSVTYYTVTFNSTDGVWTDGDTTKTAIAEPNDYLVSPPTLDPEIPGGFPQGLYRGAVSGSMVVVGWVKQGETEFYDFNTPISQDTIFNARWGSSGGVERIDIDSAEGDNIVEKALYYIAIASEEWDGENFVYTLLLNEGAISVRPNWAFLSWSTLTIRSTGGVCSINLSEPGTLFTVGFYGELILDNNITLRGIENNHLGYVVRVNSFAKFTMNPGSLVTGNSAPINELYDDAPGIGVLVNGFDALFTLQGGSITNNGTHLYPGGGVCINNGTFYMTSGTISGNTGVYGGGVFIVEDGRFMMTGGTITGNTAYIGGGVYGQYLQWHGGSPPRIIYKSGGTISGNIITEPYYSAGSQVCYHEYINDSTSSYWGTTTNVATINSQTKAGLTSF